MVNEALLSTAMLVCVDASPAAGEVKFDLNPEQIELTRRSTAGGAARATSPNATGSLRPGGRVPSVPMAPAAPAALNITINKLFFYGAMTQTNCEKLLSWVQHAAQLRPGRPYTVISSRPPKLTFVWGPPVGGFTLDVLMTFCTVTYTRFLPSGTPIRADVKLTLQEHAPAFPGTNPTSGGVPGRGAHVLHAGETLQSLALEHYGTEQAWRRIAEANGVDDPLRTRPGHALYLPAENGQPGAVR